MKKLLLLAIVILIIGCENKTTEIRYYPSDREFQKDSIQLIGLDTTKLNFRQLTNKSAEFYVDEGKQVVVEFDDGKIKKRVIPYVYTGGLIKLKNILQLKSDSILIDDGYSISELKRILKRHYLNKGEIPQYSDSPERALVEVTIDTNQSGKELKELLTRLTRSFDEIKGEINDSIELRVAFDYFRQIPPPPPPPKPNDIIKGE
ncbi:hypothetical protein [Salinimicrobium gaetbulicola]|uniref:Outer membrane lipoprotein-sorting protein n=1 Tax=Salinimicrobium gaetbulicola TaxID=999702 RepID=A0ABW3IFK6_9FLAO